MRARIEGLMGKLLRKNTVPTEPQLPLRKTEFPPVPAELQLPESQFVIDSKRTEYLRGEVLTNSALLDKPIPEVNLINPDEVVVNITEQFDPSQFSHWVDQVYAWKESLKAIDPNHKTIIDKVVQEKVPGGFTLLTPPYKPDVTTFRRQRVMSVASESSELLSVFYYQRPTIPFVRMRYDQYPHDREEYYYQKMKNVSQRRQSLNPDTPEYRRLAFLECAGTDMYADIIFYLASGDGSLIGFADRHESRFYKDWSLDSFIMPRLSSNPIYSSLIQHTDLEGQNEIQKFFNINSIVVPTRLSLQLNSK